MNIPEKEYLTSNSPLGSMKCAQRRILGLCVAKAVFVNKVVRYSHAAIASFCSSARISFGGFNQASSILFQFLIFPDQRAVLDDN